MTCKRAYPLAVASTTCSRMIEIRAKAARHRKYVTSRMAVVAVPRELPVAILNRMQRFGTSPPLVQRG